MATDNISKKVWFKRKKYGWGWTPSTWQGWLSLAVYAVLLGAYPFFVGDDKSFSLGIFVVISVLLTGAIIGVCFLKGEKPKWSWGDDKVQK